MSMPIAGYTKIEVERIENASPGALLLKIKGKDAPIWMPRGQIRNPGLYEVGDYDLYMSVTEWVCVQKGITPPSVVPIEEKPKKKKK